MTDTSPGATWCLTPRDPLIIRDGRPFGVNSGRRMKSLSWPLPSMMAGCVRTAIGREWGAAFEKAEFRERLKQISVLGPLPSAKGELYFPAPADAICDAEDNGRRLRPQSLADGEGVDLPWGLQPVLPDADLVGSKFGMAPAWWSQEALLEWLTATNGKPLARFFSQAQRFLLTPEQDQRTHVAIDPQSSSATDGMLFATSGLILDQLLTPASANSPGTPVDVQLVMRLQGPPGERLPDEFHEWLTVGGERRIAQLQPAPGDLRALWNCPDTVVAAMNASNRWCLVLATPALFQNGWYPGWLTEQSGQLMGTLKTAAAEFSLKLVSVCNHRWKPVSGWQYEPPAGPKPVRRMLPAGSVLFFERQGSTPFDPALWLASVSDAAQDQRDGFGLGVWGIW